MGYCGGDSDNGGRQYFIKLFVNKSKKKKEDFRCHKCNLTFLGIGNRITDRPFNTGSHLINIIIIITLITAICWSSVIGYRYTLFQL